MKRFQVVNGHHEDEQGKHYRKGDVIESERELDVEWPGRFQSIGDVLAKNPVIPAVLTDSVPVPTLDTGSTATTTETQATPAISRRRRGETAKAEAGTAKFSIKKGMAGTWNVVNNATGNTMNSRRLTKAEAEALVTSLSV